MDIKYLLWIQSIREATGYALDSAASLFTYLGSVYPVILIIALLYWCIDKKWGKYIMYTDLLATFVGQFLKITFCVYRPWIRSSEIEPVASAVSGATGYSFPSGHSINSVSAFGSLYNFFKEKKRKILAVACLIIAVLVPLSRNYLEVHTPQDIIVGSFIAIIFICITPKMLDYIDKGENRDLIFATIITVFSVVVCIYAALKNYPLDYDSAGNLLVDPSEMSVDTFKTMASTIGAAFGFVFEKRFVNFTTENVTLKNKILRVVVGFVGSALIALLGMGLYNIIGQTPGRFIKYMLMTFYLIGFCPYIFNKLEKR